MPKYGQIDLMILVLATAWGGCIQRTPEIPPADSLAVRTSQVAAVNEAILANHPHFSAGRSRAPSLNVDAMDFMMGRPISDFPDIFSTARRAVSAAEMERQYPDWPIALWMRKTQQTSEAEMTFYLLYTEIGRTFGYDAQADYLVIATEAHTVKKWALFAITEY